MASKILQNYLKEAIPDWRKVDLEKLREDLAIIDWEEELMGHEDDMQASIDKLEAKLLEAQERYVPKKLQKSGNRPPWMTENIKGAIRNKLE